MNYVKATLLLFVITVQLYAQNDGDNLFDDSFLHEIYFTTVDTNTYINTKDYQSVDMIVDGTTVMNVGFKRKGNISGYTATNKFPIKIKTNKYVQAQKYDGTKEFTLHMNHEDPTMLREKLTYEICAEMGLYSLRTAFAKVYINNIYWGLFTIVEAKDEMYKQVFNDRDMDAMESIDFGDMCYEGPNIMDYENFGILAYEHDNGDYNSAWSRFITMLDKVNNTPNNVYIDTASQYLNIEDFFKYQAINVYLLNMDSYIAFRGNQRYVYDESASKWQVTPWDFNASFGLWNTNNHTVTTYPLLPNFSCFGNKINDIPALKNYYFDGMCALTETVCDTMKMNARIDALKAQIQAAVYADYRKVVTNQDFDEGLEYGYHQLFNENQPALKTVLKERFELITNELNTQNYVCPTTNSNTIVDEKSVKIYPNPTHDIIYFDTQSLDNQNEITVSIVDVKGQLLLEKTINNNRLNIAKLNAGLYYCLIKTGKQVIVQKIVKY